MASSIVPGNIDGTFPVAGQDNSSQGFRDNFTASKNNFTHAKDEIEALQTYRAALNADNSFGDNLITRAVLKDTAMTVYVHGTTGGSITLNHENGHYQTITTNATTTIAFTNWPATNTVGRILLQINFANTGHTLTTPAAVLHADDITGESSNVITPNATGIRLYEFITPDAGTTVLMNQLGKIYD
jgi:hypothetical protein